MSKPLSPAAQAVKDAALAMYAGPNVRRLAWPLDMPVVVATLRAAAYQVVPDDPLAAPTWTDREEVRAALLAIADELAEQS